MGPRGHRAYLSGSTAPQHPRRPRAGVFASGPAGHGLLVLVPLTTADVLVTPATTCRCW